MTDAGVEGRPTATASAASARVRTATTRALGGLVVALLVLADVLAFNQLATQSPTDAIIQLTVVGVGFAGAIESIRRLVFVRGTGDRLLGVPMAALAALAIVDWRVRWPVGIEVLACAAAAALSVVAGLRSLSRADDDPAASQVPGVFSVAQALVFAWFAVLAGIDARAVLFG